MRVLWALLVLQELPALQVPWAPPVLQELPVLLVPRALLVLPVLPEQQVLPVRLVPQVRPLPWPLAPYPPVSPEPLHRSRIPAQLTPRYSTS